VSNIEHHTTSPKFILAAMESFAQILSVEMDDGDGVMVRFSDGTVAGYVAEELLELRPCRPQFKEVAPTVTLDTSNTSSSI
jgi:hypothetical protein